jgi:hypothetical protein
MRKDDYGLARMDLVYNKLYKFTHILIIKCVNEYKI